MLEYPNINPVILHISDTFQIRWYGFLYVVGFVAAWALMRYRSKRQAWAGWTTDLQFDLFFYLALGVILGGRIGFILFYQPAEILDDPLTLLKVWVPGRSFHGGLIGVILALLYFSRAKGFRFWEIADRICPVVPIGLACGRLGNFINGELWGKPTEAVWGMVYPYIDMQPRHPWPLYAVLLEGALLFTVLWLFSKKIRPVGVVSGMFLIGYGLVRIFEEFFRQPDLNIGYLALGWVTLGQLLCLPMVLFGIGLLMMTQYRGRS
jgi:phosphatidylglycerol---prolipoprotein diacylglyceryl transferase